MSQKYDEKQYIQTKCMNNFWSHCICIYRYIYVFIVLLLTSFFCNALIMLGGVLFRSEIREIFFRVIDFVESGKSRPRIPMNNTTAHYLNAGYLGVLIMEFEERSEDHM